VAPFKVFKDHRMSLEELCQLVSTGDDHWIDLLTGSGSKAAAEVNAIAMQECYQS
jgi:hypothetical protein